LVSELCEREREEEEAEEREEEEEEEEEEAGFSVFGRCVRLFLGFVLQGEAIWIPRVGLLRNDWGEGCVKEMPKRYFFISDQWPV
jgi:hypothetical protein